MPVRETLKTRQQPDALVEIAAKPDKKPRASTKTLENNHISTRTDPTTPADANDANDANDKCTEKGKDVRAEKKRKAEEEDVKPAVLPNRSGLADRPKKKSRKSSSVGTKGDPIQLDSE